MKKRAIIIGAGPAGLTAAYELINRTDIQPIIIEKSSDIGGISKTVNYNGNRIDIGGHRFFSKSDRVMDWWLKILPLEKSAAGDITIQYQQQSRLIDVSFYPHSNDANDNDVMLVRKRLSRIYHDKKFFNYPLSLSLDTINKLGLRKFIQIAASYAKTKIWPHKETKTLEDFFINRFGRKLYNTFFKDYTEKVWGVPCNLIDAEWGVQRIKELSIGKAVLHALKGKISIKKDNSISQKTHQTSLIERFLYPKYGPGQMWEEVAEKIRQKGGQIFMRYDVVGVDHSNNRITSIKAINRGTGKEETFEGHYFFSSMAVSELITGMNPAAPIRVRAIANGLEYRDFITVGVLLKKLKIQDEGSSRKNSISDNWIYIQDHSVKLGRVQIYNNWSPFMVKDPNTLWLGLEYFCRQGDELWSMSDSSFVQFAIDELQQIGFINKEDVLDTTIIRMEKTYPAYFGTYPQFDIIKNYTDIFSNLFLVGRNGMHKYNNSDHSMLTAMTAVDNIIGGILSKENIWQVNTEQEYHEKT